MTHREEEAASKSKLILATAVEQAVSTAAVLETGEGDMLDEHAPVAIANAIRRFRLFIP